MWDAEGFLNKPGTPYFMDAWRQCIDELVRRCLVERVEYIVDDDYHSVEYLKIHEAFRDMAIDIAKRREHAYLQQVNSCRAFRLTKFPGIADEYRWAIMLFVICQMI